MRVSNDTLRQFLTSSSGAEPYRGHPKQVSTGKRVNTPSDDPVASARIAELDASLSRLDQYQSNGTIARNQLGLEEQSLGSVIDNLQRVRELALQANSATLSDGDRGVIANELRERRDALLALANTTDVNGRYIFRRLQRRQQAFSVDASGAISYNGDQGQRTLQVSDTRFIAVNDSGTQIFQRIPSGNGTFTLGVASTTQAPACSAPVRSTTRRRGSQTTTQSIS